MIEKKNNYNLFPSKNNTENDTNDCEHDKQDDDQNADLLYKNIQKIIPLQL